MTIAFIALAVLVILGVVMVITGRWDPAMSRPDRPVGPSLPEEWTAADVESLKLRVGLRGYRMEDVDAVLASLAAQLADQSAASAAISMDPQAETTPAPTN